MPFSIGDKVRFLNSKEKGRITKIIDESTVVVDIEGGFEIPVSLADLVADSFPVAGAKPAVVPNAIEATKKTDTTAHSISFVPSKKDKLFVCFEAIDSSNVSNSDLIVSIANTTSYHLLLAYFTADDGDFKWNKNAEVVPNSTVELFRLKREKINECREIRFQVLFYKKEKAALKAPVQAGLKVKQDKLFIEKSFETSQFVPGRAVITELYSIEPPLTIPEDELRLHFENSKIEIKDKLKIQSLKLQETRVEEKEIDLHIEELIDNISGMSNAQIVQLQLSYFLKSLDEAIALRLKKLIVIHGIGTGRLKAEVYKALQNYPKLKYQDASYAKYGFGATEILIY